VRVTHGLDGLDVCQGGTNKSLTKASRFTIRPRDEVVAGCNNNYSFAQFTSRPESSDVSRNRNEIIVLTPPYLREGFIDVQEHSTSKKQMGSKLYLKKP
jgi:hypothetical protein